jgi:lysophospholipase
MKQWQFNTLACGNGEQLRYATYSTQTSNAKEWLVFLGGRNEFLEKYASLPADLALPPHWGFLSWDHRGHGASSGAPCHIDSYETYAKDTKRIIEHCIGENTPYTILAHSMGALISLYAAMKYYIKPQKLILCSPLLGIPNHPLPRMISRPLSYVLAKIGMASRYIDQKKYPKEEFAENHLTHDPEKYRFLKKTPYAGRSATFGWINASYEAIRYVQSTKGISQLRAPVYILSAEDEQVVDPIGPSDFVASARKVGSFEIVHEIITKAKHELLFEEAEIYRQALIKISDWLNLSHEEIEMTGR